ncbi:non-ribosomal peptide synthetase [Chitinophaga pendula]|uniref:non-ribosomal peptide synthetase n=1 Tax=Chitinophaga TaxID=79328 RepID=UPI000BAE8C76|nr:MULTISPECIES: non-ribosomal peptide synthetase [Chitinophaga]ASZ09481.1 hypothetical protein CK934_00050 [Chitinophaga sp. MD30]UCJ07589.1 non-ribosomal peptide synthetase [Chitinophaga pendula]
MNEDIKKGLSDEYWFRRLSTGTEKPDFPGSTGETGHYAEKTVFPEQVTSQVWKLCNEKEQLLYICLLSAFSQVFARYSQCSRFIVMTTLPGQTSDRCFYLSLSPDRNTGFRQSLLLLQQALKEVQEYLPVDESLLREKLKANDLEENLIQAAHVGFFSGKPEVIGYPADIGFYYYRDGQQLVGEFVCQQHGYETALIRQFFSHTARLLELAMVDLEKPLGQLQYLSDPELDLLHTLAGRNELTVPTKRIFEYIKDMAVRQPDAIAIVYNEERWSYAAFCDSVVEQTTFLTNCGCRVGTMIGVHLDRSPRMLIAVMAIWQAGGVYLPLHPDHPHEKLKGQIDGAGISLLITGKKYIKEAHCLQWECNSLEILYCIDTDDVYAEPEQQNESMDRSLWEYMGERSADPIAMGGWYNSFTGLPFSKEEMEEYAENARLRLMPYLHKTHTRVLEIGCASGLTMYKIAPLVKDYVAVDISATIIRYHQELLQQGIQDNITLQVMAAHEIDQLATAGTFDVIIINSVIQNFHGYNYLREVICKGIAHCSTKAVLFLGDIMDSDSRQEMITALKQFKAAHSGGIYRTKTDWKDELFVARSFFDDLQEQFPEILSVTHAAKHATLRNELTDYRYDTLLEIDKTRCRSGLYDRKKYQYDRSALRDNVTQANTPVLASQDLAYIIYTSGSTGEQKGVMVEHAGMMNHLCGKIADLSLTAVERISQNASQSFDISIWQMFTALFLGGTTFIYDTSLLMRPESWMQQLRNDAVTVLEVVPSYLSEMLEIIDRKGPALIPASLKYLLVTGEVVKPQLINRWLQYYPQIAVVNAYGPTEASDDITHFITQLPVQTERVPVGRPLPNCRIYLLDAAGQLCPPGVKGEICVTGICTGRGYLNDPVKTAAAFISDPVNISNPYRIYRTGDIGRWLPDGNLEFFGRRDTQVKIRGYRIELEEIAFHLLQHLAVREAEILALPDANGNYYLQAVVTPRQGQSLEIQDIRASLEERLPVYEVPEHYLVLDNMPLTDNGKIDRRKLMQLSANYRDTSYEAPVGQREQYLAEVWSLLLNKPVIGANDNFFDQGGHSLKATRLVAQVFKDTGITLDIRHVFQYPTIRQLAQIMDTTVAAVYTPIPRALPGELHPVSHAQQRMWILGQIAESSAAYNISGAFYMQGDLDIAALRYAVINIFQRHQILRTRFLMTTAGLRQEILPLEALGELLLEHDYTHVGDWKQNMENWLEQEAAKAIDLSVAPLLRIFLVKGEPAQYAFVYVMHHIISDGVSAKILLQEINLLYTAALQQQNVALTPEPLQYIDYVYWNEQAVQEEPFRRAARYWQERFSGEIPLLDLPVDHERPAVKTYAGHTITVSLMAEQVEQVLSLSRQQDCSRFTVLLAAIAALMYRYTGQEALVIGTPSAGREHPDMQQMVGLFFNSLPLLIEVDPTATFTRLVQQTRDVLLEAQRHQVYPFDELVDTLALQRDLSRTPLYDMMAMYEVMEEDRENELQLPGMQITLYRSDFNVSKFDLTWSFIQHTAGITLELNYNRDLFEADSIQRMIRCFMSILTNLLQQPAISIAGAALLPALDIQQQKKLSSPATTEDVLLHILFARQVTLDAEGIAVTDSTGDITYGQLNEMSHRWTSSLRDKVSRGDTVLLLMDRSADMIAAVIALFRLGAAYVPADVHWPSDRLAFIAADSGAVACLSQQSHAAAAYMTGMDVYFTPVVGQSFATDMPVNDPSVLAYLIYTSGTTGTPKGVEVPHSALANFCSSMLQQPGISSSDIVLSVTNYTFDISVLELFVPLCAGARVVIPSAAVLPGGEAFFNYLQTTQPTIIQSTPAMWQLIVKNCSLLLSNVKALIGGELVSCNLGGQLLAYCREVWNMYGPTETTIWSAIQKIRRSEESSFVGRPIHRTTVYILDDAGNIVPDGVFGEVVIGGTGVAIGYRNKAALNTEKFMADPYLPGERLFKTGDRGRWHANGMLEIKGRKDDMIKLQGYRIEPGEIRNTLLKYPDITDAVVIPCTSQGDTFLAAYIVEQVSTDLAALRQFLGRWLPGYMIPAVFVRLESIPLNSNGKVDRKRLPDPLTDIVRTANYQVPVTAAEKTLAAIWEDILGREAIGVHDNFFEMGGHSIKAVRMLMEMGRTLSIEPSLRDLFLHPTISSLLEHFSPQQKGTSYIPIATVAVQEYYPVSAAQKRLWTLGQITEMSQAYHMPATLIISHDTLNHAALRQSIQYVQQRHESLRTVFKEQEGTIYQQILPAENCVPELSIDNIPAATWETIVKQRIEAAVLQPFDLVHGPLWRINAVTIEELDTWVLHLNVHHIVCDGWSLEVLQQELLGAYRNYCNNSADTTDTLALQYKDYVSWQQQQLAEADVHRHYWLHQLGGELPVLELSTDHRRPVMQTFNGGELFYAFPKEQLHRLQALSRQQSVSLFMLLTAALKALLHYYTGQQDILLGMPVNGRTHPDLNQQVGLYINTLVLRTRFSHQDSFTALLSKVRETMLEAQEHGMYPFDQLIEELNPARILNRATLFDIMVDFYDDGAVLQRRIPDVRRMDTDFLISKFDMTLTFALENGQLGVYTEYNSDLFLEQTVAAMQGHYSVLLDTILEHPDTPLMTLECLTQQERYALQSMGSHPVEFPSADTILDRWQVQASKWPGHTAVVCGKEYLTYQQLEALQTRVSACLLHQGARKGNKIGLLMDRSERVVAAMLGIMQMGGVYVPIDASYPKERIRQYLLDADITMLITDGVVDADCKQLTWEELMTGTFPIDPILLQNNAPAGTDLAYILYTSGSSGRSKGVMIDHSALLNAADGWLHSYELYAFPVRLLSTASISFDVFCGDVCRSLLSGGTLVIATTAERMAIPTLAALYYEQQIAIFETTPSLMLPMLEHLYSEGKDISFAKYLILGSDKCMTADYMLLQHRYGHHARILNSYGITEATIDSTFYDARLHGDYSSITQVPIGKPLPNVECFVMNRYGRLLPSGMEGELFIGGPGVAAGYYNDTALSARRFYQHPSGIYGRLLSTGDRVKWLQGGMLAYMGREDGQVKLRGYRISLEEVEAVMRQLPAVDDAWADVKVDSRKEQLLVVYYKAAEPIEDTILRTHAATFLPDYMIPALFALVTTVSLSSNGKVDRRLLPAIEELIGETAGDVTPASPEEERLREIWKEVLGKEQIGVQENFFTLGGQSLKAVQLVFAVAEKLRRTIQMKDVFMQPTIRAMSHVLAQPGRRIYEAITPVTSREWYPLSNAQMKFWLEDKMERRKEAYHIPAAFLLEGRLNVTALQQAYHQLIERHASLRTVISIEVDMPVQVILPADGKLYQMELAEMPEDAHALQIDNEIITHAATTFDLAQGPLIRTKLLRLSAEKHLFLFNMHHIISDEWSTSIIIRELLSLYAGMVTGVPALLPVLAIQYGDYVIWQEQIMNNPESNQKETYWKSVFDNTVTSVRLPGDYLYESVVPYEGSALHTLPPILSKRMEDYCRQQHITLYHLLFSAYAILLGRLTGLQDFLLGTIALGRQHPDTKNMIGAFVNTVPVRSRPAEEKTLKNFLITTREELLQALENQDYPLEALMSSNKAGGNKNYQLHIVFEMNSMDAPLDFYGLRVTACDVAIPKPAQFDLALSCLEQENGILCNWTYDKTLFFESTIQQLQLLYQELIQLIINRPDLLIRDIRLAELLPGGEAIPQDDDRAQREQITSSLSNIDFEF